MRKLTVALGLALAATVVRADVIDLSRVRIVRARGENPQQKIAADELEKHLRLVCGSEVGETGFAFVFARPKDATNAAHSAFARRTGDTVYFWGDDKGTRRYPYYGSAFAVYGFLETALGVRWVRPGDDGIVFKPQRAVDLPADWTYAYRSWATTALLRRVDPEWGRRHRYAEMRPFPYRHAFTRHFETYGKEHPEYFGLSPEGVRGVSPKFATRAKFCLSNPDVVKLIVDEWERAGTGPYLNVCPNDGTPGYCFCSGCRALDADRPGEPFYVHKTDRYLNFWNRIIELARGVRPDVTLVSYIYSYYRFAPRRERLAYPDQMLFGVVPSMNDDYRSDFEGFRRAGLKRFFLRPNYLAYRGELPRGLERFLYDTFHFYADAGSIGYDYDGGYRPSMGLEYYVVLRETAFPGLSFEAILDEYAGQYGAAAETAKAYFARIRARGEASRARVAARMKRDQADVLDDSELAYTAVSGHTAAALAEDLALLERADVSALSSAEARRFAALVADARRYCDVFPSVLAQAEEKAKSAAAWEREKRETGAPKPVADGATVSQLNPRHREYFSLPAAERRRRFGDAACRKLMRSAGTRPEPVTLAWAGAETCDVKVVRPRDGKLFAAFRSQSPARVFNLETGDEYAWTASADGVRVAGGTFRTADEWPRWIGVPDAPEMRNMRDLGGLVGLDGRRIRQGLVYRSAGLNSNARNLFSEKEVRRMVKDGTIYGRCGRADQAEEIRRLVAAGEIEKIDFTHIERPKDEWRNGASRVATPAAQAFLAKTLGIRTDLDLRSDREVWGMTGSPIGPSVRWVRAPSKGYGGMNAASARAGFKKAFAVFLDERNYPIDFHCIAGADRTGTLACILEGLLGVAEDDLYKDWEATAFFNSKMSFALETRFDKLIALFNAYPGATLNERIEAYVLSNGFTKADIETLRRILLEPKPSAR